MRTQISVKAGLVLFGLGIVQCSGSEDAAAGDLCGEEQVACTEGTRCVDGHCVGSESQAVSTPIETKEPGGDVEKVPDPEVSGSEGEGEPGEGEAEAEAEGEAEAEAEAEGEGEAEAEGEDVLACGPGGACCRLDDPCELRTDIICQCSGCYWDEDACFPAPPEEGSGVCGDGDCTEGETAESCTEDCGCGATWGVWTDCAVLAPAGCWCDDSCVGRGDCCPDACDACGSCGTTGGIVCGDGYCDTLESATTCTEDCGCDATEGFFDGCDDVAPGGCHCDDGCVSRGDCCPDACSKCGSCSACGDGLCDAQESDATCTEDCGCVAMEDFWGSCDARADGGCFCDGDCVSMGDCCSDACDICGECIDDCGDGYCDSSESATTCTEDCGCDATEGFFDGCDDEAPDGCYCDEMCAARGDCCPDACTKCGACE